MSGYRIFHAADKRLDEIWEYTCEQWGEDQAEKYMRGLHRHVQQLADREKLWLPMPTVFVVPPDLEIKPFFSHYEKHYLFFRELGDGALGLFSVLHETMNIPIRLADDLRKIE